VRVISGSTLFFDPPVTARYTFSSKPFVGVVARQFQQGGGGCEQSILELFEGRFLAVFPSVLSMTDILGFVTDQKGEIGFGLLPVRFLFVARLPLDSRFEAGCRFKWHDVCASSSFGCFGWLKRF